MPTAEDGLKTHVIFDVIASRCSIIEMLDNYTVVGLCFNDGPWKTGNEDKMHLQTLRVQELKRFKAISASYPDKNWCLGTLKEMLNCMLN